MRNRKPKAAVPPTTDFSSSLLWGLHSGVPSPTCLVPSKSSTPNVGTFPSIPSSYVTRQQRLTKMILQITMNDHTHTFEEQ